jgi:hypothetical protein
MLRPLGGGLLAVLLLASCADPVEAPLDGPDAAAQDVAGRDAGPGRDATVTDRPTDAGDADGGADGADARAPDAELLDAGTPDADAADAAPTDAGGAACPIGLDETFPATLRITTDDHFTLFVNGVLVDDTPRIWTQPQTYTLALFRHPARANVLAVAGLNTMRINGLDRAVVADLALALTSTPASVVTDTRWRVRELLEPDWWAVEHDDAAWGAAVDQGPHGSAPYFSVLGTSSARLLWSYPANVPALDKPERETIYLRRRFYVTAAGEVSDVPTPCP